MPTFAEPWSYRPNRLKTRDGHSIDGNDGKPVAFLAARLNDGTGKAATLGNLLSAAPDLYDACKMAREALAWARKQLPPSPQDGDGFPIEFILDMAIAKAEGRDGAARI